MSIRKCMAMLTMCLVGELPKGHAMGPLVFSRGAGIGATNEFGNDLCKVCFGSKADLCDKSPRDVRFSTK